MRPERKASFSTQTCSAGFGWLSQGQGVTCLGADGRAADSRPSAWRRLTHPVPGGWSVMGADQAWPRCVCCACACPPPCPACCESSGELLTSTTAAAGACGRLSCQPLRPRDVPALDRQAHRGAAAVGLHVFMLTEQGSSPAGLLEGGVRGLAWRQCPLAGLRLRLRSTQSCWLLWLPLHAPHHPAAAGAVSLVLCPSPPAADGAARARQAPGQDGQRRATAAQLRGDCRLGRPAWPAARQAGKLRRLGAGVMRPWVAAMPCLWLSLGRLRRPPRLRAA